MTGTNAADARRDQWMRRLVWGGAAALLLLPLVAMQFTREVDWDGRDFALMAVLLAMPCALYELALRLSPSPAYRAGFGLAALAGFLLVWVNLAVGMVGSERNPYNLWFGAVLATGLAGAALARFRAPGLVRAALAAAAVQALVSGYALVAGPDPLGATLSSFWILFWLAAARCFRWAGDPARSRARQRLAVHALLAGLGIVFGTLLLGVMVTLEGEPGLLPLAMIAAGIGWSLLTRWRSRRLAE